MPMHTPSILVAVVLLWSTLALAQPIGEDDGPIGGAAVGGAAVGQEDDDAPVGGPAMGGAAVGQEDDDAPIGGAPLN